ncbi:SRPBCC family protein [Sphingobium estronivorans]|uniref:SRPBCC family protein n=1 Tax=Sphingobium estronivorans TaxID=1577690 RepID=UPI0012397379|nr:carbon monoxide dehydrogenase subunit G [Sphingobium estronivorans]
MDMTGEQRIPADRDTVWKALNDADILRACIPGCQELVKESDTEMTAIAVIKVGPISARFQGRVTLSDLDPPNGYRISGEGQGGVAGHAKGGAAVRLTEDGDGTILHYDVSAQIGGRLAQLGGRMIDATARSMSAAFFKKFAEEILARQAGAAVGAQAQAQPEAVATAPAAARVAARAALAPVPALQPGGSLLWAVSGMLLGLLLMGLFGLPLLGRGIADDTNVHILSLVAVILALLQGYLLGRQAPARL